MATYVERILVPDAARSRLLVVEGVVPSLPTWSLEDPEPVDSFRMARVSFGVMSPFLRVVRLAGDDMRDREVFQLLEFDAPPVSWGRGYPPTLFFIRLLPRLPPFLLLQLDTCLRFSARRLYNAIKACASLGVLYYPLVHYHKPDFKSLG